MGGSLSLRKRNQAMARTAPRVWSWSWWSLNDVVVSKAQLKGGNEAEHYQSDFIIQPPPSSFASTSFLNHFERCDLETKNLRQKPKADSRGPPSHIMMAITCLKNALLRIIIILTNFDVLVKNIDLVTLSDAVGRLCEPHRLNQLSSSLSLSLLSLSSSLGEP